MYMRSGVKYERDQSQIPNKIPFVVITYCQWAGNTSEILFNNKSIWSARYQDNCVLGITPYTNYDLARSLL